MKPCELIASHFNTKNKRTNTGEKYFDDNIIWQTSSYVVELTPHQISQCLEPSFKCNEPGNAFIKCKSAYPKHILL